eukprot:s3148_g1.t1
MREAQHGLVPFGELSVKGLVHGLEVKVNDTREDIGRVGRALHQSLFQRDLFSPTSKRELNTRLAKEPKEDLTLRARLALEQPLKDRNLAKAIEGCADINLSRVSSPSGLAEELQRRLCGKDAISRLNPFPAPNLVT